MESRDELPDAETLKIKIIEKNEVRRRRSSDETPVLYSQNKTINLLKIKWERKIKAHHFQLASK